MPVVLVVHMNDGVKIAVCESNQDEKRKPEHTVAPDAGNNAVLFVHANVDRSTLCGTNVEVDK